MMQDAEMQVQCVVSDPFDFEDYNPTRQIDARLIREGDGWLLMRVQGRICYKKVSYYYLVVTPRRRSEVCDLKDWRNSKTRELIPCNIVAVKTEPQNPGDIASGVIGLGLIGGFRVIK